ncbi:MAG: tetratricopeptide repeat protein [Gemmatales bacterium]
MAVALRFVDELWSRCSSLAEAGQLGKVRPLLERLLHMDLPQSIRAEATLMLADLLRAQGEYHSARKHLSAALAGDPQDPSLHHMLGYLHHEDDHAGNFNRALKHLRHAARLAPDSSECHRALGEYLFKHENQQRGMTHLRKAVELEPENLDSLRSLVSAQVEQDQVESARQTIRLLQFRLGRAHPTVQSLWNELAYAITLKAQHGNTRLSTVPMLKAVTDEPRNNRTDAVPQILRFDAGHGPKQRPSRRVPKRES